MHVVGKPLSIGNLDYEQSTRGREKIAFPAGWEDATRGGPGKRKNLFCLPPRFASPRGRVLRSLP